MKTSKQAKLEEGTSFSIYKYKDEKDFKFIKYRNNKQSRKPVRSFEPSD